MRDWENAILVEESLTRLQRYTKETIWHLTYQVKEFHLKTSKCLEDRKHSPKRLFLACVYFYSMLCALYADIGGENVEIQLGGCSSDYDRWSKVVRHGSNGSDRKSPGLEHNHCLR